MAYAQELRTHCSVTGCGKWATVEVFDRWNGSLGKFCNKSEAIFTGQTSGPKTKKIADTTGEP